jgi:hypothetical protein
MLAVSCDRAYLNTPASGSEQWAALMFVWANYINGYADLKRIDDFGDEVAAEWWRKEFPDTRILSDLEKGIHRI